MEDQGVDERIILKCVFDWMGGMEWINLAQGRRQVAGSCEYGDEPSGSIKRWEFLE